MTWVPPTSRTVQAYVRAWPASEVDTALAAESAAQLKVVNLPTDDDPDNEHPYPADLAEALSRRVHRNLAMRNLPLGFQALASEASVVAARVGQDPEIRRLEAPYRKRVVA